jgi:peptide/nickel transport system substrate-binding protein
MTKLSRRVMAAAAAAGLATGPLPVLAQGRPRRGGTTILALEGEPSTLTSHLATDTPAMMVANNLFNALVLLNEKLEPIPDLATRWTVSSDGRVHGFELVQNARWHDGELVTATDVEYTFNEIIAKLHPRAGSWWPNVERSKATGTHAFEFRLKQPFAPFLTILSIVLSSGTGAVSRHASKDA